MTVHAFPTVAEQLADGFGASPLAACQGNRNLTPTQTRIGVRSPVPFGSFHVADWASAGGTFTPLRATDRSYCSGRLDKPHLSRNVCTSPARQAIQPWEYELPLPFTTMSALLYAMVPTLWTGTIQDSAMHICWLVGLTRQGLALNHFA